MRRMFSLILLIVFVTSATAGTRFESDEEFSQWFTFYYEKPEPDRVPYAVRCMSESGVLDDKNAIAPMFGFLSGTFRDNPERMASWVSQLKSLNEQHLGVVVLGVWYSALPESRKTAHALLENHPKLQHDFELLFKGAPMTVEEIPLEQGPWVLDALWGKFMATGVGTPVERVISSLPWLDAGGDPNRLVVGGAAKWSLTSNAVQHKRVLEICEASEKTQSTEVAAKLAEVIKNAKKEIQAQHEGVAVLGNRGHLSQTEARQEAGKKDE